MPCAKRHPDGLMAQVGAPRGDIASLALFESVRLIPAVLYHCIFPEASWHRQWPALPGYICHIVAILVWKPRLMMMEVLPALDPHPCWTQ